MTQQAISDSLRHAVRLEVSCRCIDVHGLDDRRWSRCETLKSDKGCSACRYLKSALQTNQSHPGTQHLAERIKPDDPAAPRNDLRLELKVTLGALGREKVVRIVLDDDEIVFVRKAENVEFTFAAGTGARWVGARGDRAAEGDDQLRAPWTRARETRTRALLASSFPQATTRARPAKPGH